MSKIQQIDVPQGSLLAEYGPPESYRDCFIREVPDSEGRTVSLPEFMERFYTSAAFLPERLILKSIAGPSSSDDARALARGETDRFGAWVLAERKDAEILLASKSTGTASWFAVEPLQGSTRLLFGSWVGNIDRSGWRFMLRAHVWYSRVLLGGV